MSDNLAALIYLKSKVHKWKNIAVLFAIFSLILVIKFIFGGSLSEGPFTGDYIASIKIEGVIFEDDFRSKALQEIAEEDSIKAVIVNIDSPGGGIVGSEILFEDLRAIAAKKPMVVVMGSVAASGGYMAAVASDYIIAHNGTLTGSIGVLMEAQEFTELAKKVGVKFNTYKSAPLKASPSPFEKTTPLVDRVVQESVIDSYHFFTDLVLDRRGARINKNFANIVFDGRVFTGRQALRAGLIDQIGGKDQALSYLEANKVNVKKLPLHEIEIVKKDEKFLDKFTGLIPFLDGVKTANSSHQIMAIMK
ncbi:MAG: signal peptide peptidase SppA [Rickettsiales bacterium]|nr:signal peptide peptidase SppA [Rickettsiales bacterium]